MKKLLALLGAASLVTSASTVVVACGDNGEDNKDKETSYDVATALSTLKGLIEKEAGYESEEAMVAALTSQFKDTNVTLATTKEGVLAPTAATSLLVVYTKDDSARWTSETSLKLNLQIFEAGIEEEAGTPEPEEPETETPETETPETETPETETRAAGDLIWNTEATSTETATAKLVQVKTPTLSTDAEGVQEINSLTTSAQVSITVNDIEMVDGKSKGKLYFDKDINAEDGKSAYYDFETSKMMVDGNEVSNNTINGQVLKINFKLDSTQTNKMTLTILADSDSSAGETGNLRVQYIDSEDNATDELTIDYLIIEE